MKKCKHKMKVVGYCFGGFSSNPYKVLRCIKCKKYNWEEISEEEIAKW